MQKLVATKMLKRAVLFALLIGLSMVTVVSAITITVDGVREGVWAGSGGQTPGIQSDANEGGITDGYDVEEVLWTNDQTNFYFLMQTYANTIWTGTPRPTLVICIDTDDNTATGGTYANCNNMTGIDRSIVVDRGAGTTLNVDVLDSDPNTGNSIGAGIGARTNPSGVVNEVSVSLADLGLNSAAACSGPMPAVIYFDNGVVDPDDNTPDTGTFNLTCGAPTAVTLANANAQSQTGYFVVLALVGVFGLGLLSFATVQKRR